LNFRILGFYLSPRTFCQALGRVLVKFLLTMLRAEKVGLALVFSG
jgi:hypothetical protein